MSGFAGRERDAGLGRAVKVYCINLDRRPDRLEHMQGQFDRLGLAFERIAAVDGADPAVAEAARSCPPGMTGLPMSAAAYGCLQSHRLAWARLVASGASHAMIFEDDLILAEGLVRYADPGWVPADADLVRLETFLTRFHRDRGQGIGALGRQIHRLRSRHVGAGGYVITARAAARLIAATEVCGDPVDEVLFNDQSHLFGALTVYQMIPAPVIQGKVLMKEQSGWIASSISERFATAAEADLYVPEANAGKLLRRLREELRSVAVGTVYEIAPFG